MKKAFIKRFTFVLLISAVVLLVSVVACSSDVNSDTGNPDELDLSKFKLKTVDFVFFNSAENKVASIPGAIDLYFTSEKSQIPYIKLSDAADLLMFLHLNGEIKMLDLGFNIKNNNIVIVNNDTMATMEVDKGEHKIIFSDYDRFFQKKYMVTCNDSVSAHSYIEREKGYDVPAGERIIDYGSYGIEIFSGLVDGTPEVLMPLRTLCDLDKTGMLSRVSYNGKCIVFGDWYSMLTSDREELSDLGKIYFDTDCKERSEELIDFNYNELVFNMSLNYGLQERQGITSFDDSFKAWGVKKKLYSTDTDVSSQAICDMVYSNIGDQHSNFGVISPYAKEFKILTPTDGYSPSKAEYIQYTKTMNEARRIALNEEKTGVYPGFQLITSYTDYNGAIKNEGVTAFVRFDEFTIKSVDYSKEEIRKQLMSNTDIENDFNKSGVDTIGLIVYSNEKIKEWDNENPDNKVKNVVIDLSCNKGGLSDAALFVSCWLMGRAPISIASSTGAKSTVYYYSDVNMDGIFQSKMAKTDDTVADKNIFVITSKLSFSCGNLVPYIIKESRRGTLLGSWTGGGECVILSTATADGTLFNISGTKHICYESNGSFIGVDNGIDVDYKFATTDQYFDVNGITRRINEYLTKSLHK